MDQKYMGMRVPSGVRLSKKVLLVIFAMVIIVVVLVIMTIVILLSKNKGDDSLAIQDAGQSASSPLANASELTKGWKMLETQSYKIRMADGWDFSLLDGAVLYSSCEVQDCYNIVENEDATIVEKSAANGLNRGAYFAVQPADFNVDSAVASYTKSKTFDVGFTLYTREQTTVVDDLESTLPIGSGENILIRRESDGRTSYIYYSVLPEQRDPIMAILAMASTFELKS